MIYRCERCGAALHPGARACGTCGKLYADPVPADAEAQDPAVDALLQGRTAGGRNTNATGDSLQTGPARLDPVRLGVNPSATPSGKRGRIGIIVGACVAAAVLLGIAVWGIGTLWANGIGGDAEYMRHNLAGNAAAERGDFATADAEYTQMIALRPDRMDGYMLRAISEDKAGLYPQAIADDTAGLSLTGEHEARGDFFYNRALAWGGRGVWTRAITDYTQAGREYALVHDPRELPTVPDRQEDVLRSLADAHWERQDYAPAIADCTTVIARYHRRPDDYGIRAKCEAALRQNAAARADFIQALRMDPTYMPGYAGLASLDDTQHRPALAVGVYQAAVRANPGNVDCWGSLGWFQYEAGQYPAAIVTDRRAQSLDPNQGWINYNLALCYAVSGDSAQATLAYARALAGGSPSDRAGGLSDIRNALARQPGSAPLRLALAQVQRGAVGASPPPLAPATPFVPPAPPVAPAFASLLAPDTRQNGYAVRPPAGYTLQQSSQSYLDGSGTTDLWAGPQRGDGTTPTLQIIVSTDDGQMASEHSAVQEEQMFLNKLTGNHTQFAASQITSCTISGRRFARASWSGVGMRTGKQYGGVVYIAVTPGQYIEISTHDAAPYSQSTLPLLTASALTFRKL